MFLAACERKWYRASGSGGTKLVLVDNLGIFISGALKSIDIL